MDIQLQEIIELKGILVLESNLHIGSGKLEMHIGGTDNPIIKHPHTQEPYIPGSSIKGKIRSLLELKTGVAASAYRINPNSGGIAGLETYLKEDSPKEDSSKVASILKIFGFSGSDKSDSSRDGEIGRSLGPTRASFADCYLNADWLDRAVENMWPLAVEKQETAIDRISGTAKTGSLRQTEMVPAGAEFDFRVTFKVFKDSDRKLLEMLKEGIELLQKDAIGGSGSRGYGRIRIKDLIEV
jgi:CRISPR-associated protein Csm3